MFGPPIELDEEVARDRQRAEETYAAVKAGVTRALTYLLESRERDPYRNTLRRVAYEQIQQAQAPTFEPGPW